LPHMQMGCQSEPVARAMSAILAENPRCLMAQRLLQGPARG
jgi:hypothetical protein